MLKTVDNIDIKISGLKILSKIGEGGMSKVYLAEQISLKRKVAVKVMRLEIAENELDVQRFKQEAKTIAHLNHPNIINIYNIGQTSNGEVFFTMPYLNHGDFSNYIIENEQEFICLLQSICDGLSFAHDRGVVHRDIKPENLLFDEFGNVRIADFGIAISKNGTRMTKEHQIVGSAQYMSPEQARSLKVDVHTDIYSLGIVIYERLTGRVPFDSDESISILVNHVSAKPPKLPSKMRHWQKLIDKCLAKDPAERFQTMVELKIALSKIPTNTIQRTNSTIENILDSSIGKQLKWFIPSLIIVVIFASIYSKYKQPQIDPQNNSQLSAKNLITNSNTTKNTADKSLDAQPQKNIRTDVKKPLSIEEIKQQIALHNSINGENITVLTEEEIKQKEIQELLKKANENIEIFQLSRPKSNNATDQLLDILKMSPENPDALLGIENIGNKYFQLINSALNKQDFITALKHSKSVMTFNEKTNNANSQYNIQLDSILKTVNSIDLLDTAISADNVKTLTKIVKTISPKNTLIEEFEAAFKLKTGPSIGEKLLDEMGIETILITKDLAVTTHEVTIENYTEFVNSTNREASKCKHEAGGFGSFFNTFTWNKPLFDQSSNHPVICINQSDAQAYSEWLSQQTENRYRLPTKQEWLMLAETKNNTFNACESANIAGLESKKSRVKNQNYSCNDKYEFTAPVASFSINNNGVYDIQGNVSEWIFCDKKPCLNPIAMGSSWYDGKKSNSISKADEYKINYGYTHIGFRLVRDL